jgi:hypothetical protein
MDSLSLEQIEELKMKTMDEFDNYNQLYGLQNSYIIKLIMFKELSS